MVNYIIPWVEQGKVPDFILRLGIRRLLKQRLAQQMVDNCEAVQKMKEAFITEMHNAPIALSPEKANEQHYEKVPVDFFRVVLGPLMKYSGCYWPDGINQLDKAEIATLQTTCERAGISDGMNILELGCGWGALTLWMAEHFPHSSILAVSNSQTQREFIEYEARRRKLDNIRLVTSDMNVFTTSERFERIISLEMFEQMRNYQILFQRVAEWLKPGGHFLMHIFCHRSTVYPFLDNSPNNWVSRYFFYGGMVPSDDLPLRFQDHLKLLQQWHWDGTHYERTANAWLLNMDREQPNIMKLFKEVYGPQKAKIWWNRWRLFFMSTAELFGYNQGQEWWVSHYLFEKRA